MPEETPHPTYIVCGSNKKDRANGAWPRPVNPHLAALVFRKMAASGATPALSDQIEPGFAFAEMKRPPGMNPSGQRPLAIGRLTQ